MDLIPIKNAAMAATPAPPSVSVVARPSLFRDARTIREVAAGQSMLELILDAGMAEIREDGLIHLPHSGRLVATIDGDEVPRHMWHLIKPKAGHLVNIYLIPQNQRQAILVGASLAIAVAAFYTGGLAAGAAGGIGTTAGGFAFAATSAAISVSGAYRANPFLPLEGPARARP